MSTPAILFVGGINPVIRLELYGPIRKFATEPRFAPQTETERYLNYVADKFDLQRDIQFNSRVAAARWDEGLRSWELALDDGRRYSTRFLEQTACRLGHPFPY